MRAFYHSGNRIDSMPDSKVIILTKPLKSPINSMVVDFLGASDKTINLLSQ